MNSDALRNAIARAAREAVFRNTARTVRLPLKDVPEGPGHLATLPSIRTIFPGARNWMN
jgi:hypothetical protein